MSAAITVKGVSKRYRIGLVESEQKTFAGQLVDMVKAPFTNLKKLRSLSRFKEEDESIFWALKDVSFEVQEGEVLGIIGHNGAGKSTLLKILSRITEPTTGEITIRGRVSSLLEVGTGFHPDLTGRENIYMNGTILGMRKKEIDSKLDEIIAFSGVSKYIDTPVKRYSSGMKVRLAFSVAAHLEPEVLIIDEVLAVGDAEFQAKCLGKMKDVAEQGRTVLFVSHNMTAVKSLCKSILVLKDGQTSFIGDVTTGVGKYLGYGEGQEIVSERYFDEKESVNDHFQLKYIGFKPLSNDGIFSAITRGDEIHFICKFQSKQRGEFIDISVQFVDSNNQVCFVITSIDDHDLNRHDLNDGLSVMSFVIPSHFLNTGKVSLNVLFIKNKKDLIFRLDHILSTQVLDSKVDLGGWMGRTPGALRPKFNWSVVNNS